MSQVLFTGKVVSVSSYSFVAEGSLNPTTVFTLTFDSKFEGKVKNKDGEYEVRTDCTQLSYTRSALIAQLHKAVTGFDLAYSVLDATRAIDPAVLGFGLPQAMILLKGAVLTIDRTPYKEGDEYVVEATGEVKSYSHDGYNDAIVSADITSMAMDWLSKKIAMI